MTRLGILDQLCAVQDAHTGSKQHAEVTPEAPLYAMVQHIPPLLRPMTRAVLIPASQTGGACRNLQASPKGVCHIKLSRACTLGLGGGSAALLGTVLWQMSAYRGVTCCSVACMSSWHASCQKLALSWWLRFDRRQRCRLRRPSTGRRTSCGWLWQRAVAASAQQRDGHAI